MEYVVRYRPQLSGGDFLFLMVEGGCAVYVASRPEEAVDEGQRRLNSGEAMEWRIDTVSENILTEGTGAQGKR